MTNPTDPKRRGAREPCGALLSISEDFHQILRASCRRCITGSGPCGVEAVRHALKAEDEAAGYTPEEPAIPEHVTRH